MLDGSQWWAVMVENVLSNSASCSSLKPYHQSLIAPVTVNVPAPGETTLWDCWCNICLCFLTTHHWTITNHMVPWLLFISLLLNNHQKPSQFSILFHVNHLMTWTTMTTMTMNHHRPPWLTTPVTLSPTVSTVAWAPHTQGLGRSNALVARLAPQL